MVEFGDNTRLGYCNLAVIRTKGLEVGSYEFEFDAKGKLDIVAHFNPYGQGNFLRGSFRNMILIKDLQKTVKALEEFTDDALKLAKETEKYLGEF